MPLHTILNKKPTPQDHYLLCPIHTILNKKPTPQDHYLSCPSTPYKTRNLPLKIIICHAPPHHIKQETYPSRSLFVMPLHTILNKKPTPQDHYLSCPSTPYKTRNLPLKIIIVMPLQHHIKQETYPSRSLFYAPPHHIKQETYPSRSLSHAPPHHIKQETYP